MIAICVDDEPILLNVLKKAVEKSPDISRVVAFDDEQDALEWVRNNPCDIAFLDIELHELNGLELAERMREMQPELAIVFCTAYQQYAVQTLGMHMDCGYLMKPISAESVQEEIDHFHKKGEKPLRAVCFGSFEAFAGGKPLDFRRRKSKELLAFLIDRNGAYVTATEVCEALWDNGGGEAKYKDYFYHLLADLKQALEKSGVEGVLLSSSSGYAVNPELIECDYYRILEGNEQAVRSFHGEYMNRYKWGESMAKWLRKKHG